MVITKENRKKFESLGAATVRLDIPMGQFIESDGDRKQAIEWLSEQDRSERRNDAWRFWSMVILTAIAAVAACIAAWPVLKGQ